MQTPAIMEERAMISIWIITQTPEIDQSQMTTTNNADTYHCTETVTISVKT